MPDPGLTCGKLVQRGSELVDSDPRAALAPLREVLEYSSGLRPKELEQHTETVAFAQNLLAYAEDLIAITALTESEYTATFLRLQRLERELTLLSPAMRSLLLSRMADACLELGMPFRAKPLIERAIELSEIDMRDGGQDNLGAHLLAHVHQRRVLPGRRAVRRSGTGRHGVPRARGLGALRKCHGDPSCGRLSSQVLYALGVGAGASGGRRRDRRRAPTRSGSGFYELRGRTPVLPEGRSPSFLGPGGARTRGASSRAIRSCAEAARCLEARAGARLLRAPKHEGARLGALSANEAGSASR